MPNLPMHTPRAIRCPGRLNAPSLTPLALAAALMAAALPATAQTPAGPLPTGGNIVAGQAQIGQQGSVLTVQQASARLVTDWRSFDIAAGHTVRFDQPSASAVALNRVTGGSASVIQGALRANGQVFLVNPSGVLFSPSAQVDVGGIVASTLDITNDDFLAGRLAFNGLSQAQITNQGQLTAAQGGTVALIAARIVNDGSISAPAGDVLLGAGSRVTLDLGGPVQLRVDNDRLETLIRNGGAIRAAGGRVALVSQAANALTASVINHSGVIEADALDASQPGGIVLFAHGGHTEVSGTLSARDGSIETSGRTLSVADSATVRTAHWLVDPVDIAIEASGGTNLAGASIAASKIQDVLNGSNGETAGAVTLVADNDILVNQAVSWSSNQLTLSAGRHVLINAPLTASGTGALSLKVGQASADGAGGSWTVGSAGAMVVPAPTAFTWQKGSSGNLNNLVLNNGLIRFGNGTEASLNAAGILKQPQTFDNTTAGRNGWYNLTIGTRHLEFAIAAGGDGSNAWNYGGQVLASSPSGSGSTYDSALSNRSIDLSGYREGIGTVVTRGRITFSSGQQADIDQTYQLNAGSRFVNMATTVTNRDSATLSNVRIWLGTGDDWVGQADSNRKTKGNIVNGEFVALTDATAPSNAIRVSEGGGTEGAAVLYYSTTAGADTVHASCCSFSNSTNKDPRSSATTALNDGSYAMFMRLSDLAPGASGGMSVFYAAAPVAELTSAITSVSQAAAPTPSTTPVYLRLVSGSSVYGDTPNFSYALYDALSGGSLVSDAAPTGLANWLGAPTASSAVGTYELTYADGIALGNSGYTLSAGAGTSWTITPRTLNLGVSKVYDGSAIFNSGFVLSGLVNGDTVPSVSGSASVASRNVGTSTQLSESTLALSNPNYTLAGAAVSATITPRPITATADAMTKVYGAADPALGYQITAGSLVGGDTLSGQPTRAAGENVGSYTIALGALAHDNYAITKVDGALAITPRPITITADAKTKVYGNPDPVLSWQLTAGELLGTDALGGALSRTPGEATGPYTISAAQLANPNYTVQAINGELFILPAVNVNVMSGQASVLTATSFLSPSPSVARPTPATASGQPADAPVLTALRPDQPAGTGVLLVRAGGIRLP